MSKPKTYLRKLREWEKGDPPWRRAKAWQLYRVFWCCSVTLDDPNDPYDGDHDYIRRVGRTREEACHRCYEEAVKRGIIEEAKMVEPEFTYYHYHGRRTSREMAEAALSQRGFGDGVQVRRGNIGVEVAYGDSSWSPRIMLGSQFAVHAANGIPFAEALIRFCEEYLGIEEGGEDAE